VLSAAEIWPEKPAKAREKETDARWTVKFSKARPGPYGKKQLDMRTRRMATSRISVEQDPNRPPTQNYHNGLIWRDKSGLGWGTDRRRLGPPSSFEFNNYINEFNRVWRGVQLGS
jgi:hypothetical protein